MSSWSYTNAKPPSKSSSSDSANINQIYTDVIIRCLSLIECLHLQSSVQFTYGGVNVISTIQNLSTRVGTLQNNANGTNVSLLSYINYNLTQVYNQLSDNSNMSVIHWNQITQNLNNINNIFSFVSVQGNTLTLGNESIQNIYIGGLSNSSVPQNIYIGTQKDYVYISGTVANTTHLTVSDPFIILNQGGVTPSGAGVYINVSNNSSNAYAILNSAGEWVLKNYNGPEFNLSEISNRISNATLTVNNISNNLYNLSINQWNTISALSNRTYLASLQQYTQLSNLSNRTNTASVNQWNAITSLSSNTYNTSVNQWNYMTSLSSNTYNMSVNQWNSISSLSNNTYNTSVNQWNYMTDLSATLASCCSSAMFQISSLSTQISGLSNRTYNASVNQWNNISDLTYDLSVLSHSTYDSLSGISSNLSGLSSRTYNASVNQWDYMVSCCSSALYQISYLSHSTYDSLSGISSDLSYLSYRANNASALHWSNISDLTYDLSNAVYQISTLSHSTYDSLSGISSNLSNLSNRANNASMIQWDYITDLSATVASCCSSALLYQISFLSHSTYDSLSGISSDLSYLSYRANNASAFQWLTLSDLSFDVNTLSSNTYNASVNQWNRISNLSFTVNSVSIIHWNAITSLSNGTYTASISHWNYMTSLSTTVASVSITHWNTIISLSGVVNTFSGYSTGSGGGGGNGTNGVVFDYLSVRGNGAKRIFYSISIPAGNYGFSAVLEGGYYKLDTNDQRQFTNTYAGCRTTGLSGKITVANNTASDDNNLIKMELRVGNTGANVNYFDIYLDSATANRQFVMNIRQYRNAI
jgi:hypothetical protein